MSGRTIHRLSGGLPPCGFSQAVPGEWPAGHCWTNDPEADLDKEGGDVLCPGCWERPRCSAAGTADCGPCQLEALKAALPATRCQGCGDVIPEGSPYSERVDDGCPFCPRCAAENAASEDPDEMRPGTWPGPELSKAELLDALERLVDGWKVGDAAMLLERLRGFVREHRPPPAPKG